MKVLIAIDDSECSAYAVESIIKNHWVEDVAFCVMTVMEPLYVQYGLSGAYYLEPVADAQREFGDYCRQFVEAKVKQLKDKFPKSKISSKVVEGDIASSIIEEATQWGADLIIVGSHGRSGLQKFLLGSVAEKVVSHSPCSVQIVKQKSKTQARGEKDKVGSAVA